MAFQPTRCHAALAVLAVLAWTTHVGAFSQSAAAAEADPSAAKSAALKLFEQSELRYREGRFQEAAVLLREAHALDPAPILLFNLGRALEGAGDFSGAIDAYEKYLAADPKARDRSAVLQRIDALGAKLEEKDDLERKEAEEAKPVPRGLDAIDEKPKPKAEPEPEPPAPAKTSPKEKVVLIREKEASPNVAPWILAGSGAAVAIAGGVLGALALKRHQDAASEPVNATASDLAAESRRFETAANICYAVGGIAAAGGLIWALVGGGGGGGAPRVEADTRGARVSIAF